MDNKSITRSFYEAISAGRLDKIDGVVAEGFVEHEEAPGFTADREGVRQLFQAMHAAFTDFSREVAFLFHDPRILKYGA